MDVITTEGTSKPIPGNGACTTVDAVFASALRTHADGGRRDQALRLLFAVAQGCRMTGTDIDGVTEARLRGDMAIASIRLAKGVRWRAGEIVMAENPLPISVTGALRGRSVSHLAAWPHVGQGVITRASDRKEGLVIAVQLEAVEYSRLWRELSR